MRNLAFAALILILCSCTQHTIYGPCIGVVDKQDPSLNYEVSLWNGFVAILFSETIIVPVYTVAKDIQCPVSKRQE